jgi:hypothetical protein
MRTILVLSLLMAHTVFASTGGGSSIGPAVPPDAAKNCTLLGGEIRAMDKDGRQACVVYEPDLYRAMEKRGLITSNDDPSQSCQYWNGTEWGAIGPIQPDCFISLMNLGSLN